MFGNKGLKQEIQSLKERLADYESRNIELRGNMEEERNKLADEKLELRKEISKLQLEKAETERKSAELEKENDILRKYYDLDKEPSDEIKAKVHIDLEINRLKEDKMALISIVNQQPRYIPMSYYQYSPFWEILKERLGRWI